MVNVAIIFYSTYGHNYTMAQAAKVGAEAVEGAKVTIYRIKETVSLEILQKMGADKACEAWAHVPVATGEEIKAADVVLWCIPTRFGGMASQVKSFIDTLSGYWSSGAFVGKLAGVMASTSTQHGGAEATIRSFHDQLFHFGFIIGGLPYSYQGQSGTDTVRGGSPYGMTSNLPVTSDQEKEGAQFQAKHLTTIGKKLAQ